ncbi:MAG: TraB/GumN family protein [Rhodobacteraceae bacterium]|nr:MAG: TraB/GumN family protein [Paracoccaceae bacterium]
MGLRRVFLAFCALIAAGPVAAQAWATRAVCDVPAPEVHEGAFAPATEDDLAQAARAMVNARGRFWRLTSPEGAVSHLWGTMHSADRHVLDLPDLLKKRIAEARLVALEIDPVLPSRAAFEAQFERSDWFRRGDELPLAETGIDPRVLDWIRLRTEGLGWGHDAPERLTPGALAELLLSDPCNDFSSGVLPVQDGRIQMLALIAGVPVKPLEDPDRIRRHLDAPGNEGFAVDFLDIYGGYLNPATTRQVRATNIALYLEGRIGMMLAWDRAYMADLFGDGGARLARVNRYLLDARNRQFVDRIQGELAQGGVLIAVGSFHLPGRQGMIALLRDRGYSVTRIPLPGEVRK